MIADYFVYRRRYLKVSALYQRNSEYAYGGSGVSMVPSRIRDVCIAAAVRVTQASWPQTASQVKIAPQPASSAATARSTNSLGVARLMTTPARNAVTLSR